MAGARLYAAHLVIHGLHPIRASPHLDCCRNAGSAHLVDHLVATLNSGEHVVPLPFDVGAIGVQAFGRRTDSSAMLPRAWPRGATGQKEEDGYPVDSGSPNILWFGDFLGFCNRVNNHLVSRRIHGYRLLDEPIEEFASAFGVAAVETEGELVQV